MKIINHEEIQKLGLSSSEILQWIEQSISTKNSAILPPKLSLKPNEDIFFNYMPSMLAEEDITGIKIVNRIPERIPTLDSQIMLYRISTGENLALLDGNYITALRTGAVAAHSILLLGNKNFETISFIGLGNQARATVFALSSKINPAKIKFKLLKYKNQHEEFQQYLNELFDVSLNIEFVDTYEDAIKDSDIIVSSLTYTDRNLVEDINLFKQGVLLVPIHTRGFMNCDKEFDKIFADDKNHVSQFKYFNEFKQFSEVTDVMNKNREGRASEEERIIVYNIGLGIHDLFFANNIYKKINQKSEQSQNIKLNDISCKFFM